jgi:4-hydroxybenzoate polyprenyltransferase
LTTPSCVLMHQTLEFGCSSYFHEPPEVLPLLGLRAPVYLCLFKCGQQLCARELYSQDTSLVQKMNPSMPQDLAQQYGGAHTGRWVDLLPSSYIPYVQLARLSPPIGISLIYFPHIIGVILAGTLQRSTCSEVLKVSSLLFGGTFFFSNAAHGWNDIVDAGVDKRVARTQNRPIPRGAISKKAAFMFVTTQAIGAAIFLFALPLKTALYAMPNILATTYYPYAKRHTNMVQIILGFCLAWGVIIGITAIGLDPLLDANKSPLFLFLSCVAWTILYDTIYAHQDVKDDVKIGLKSTAVFFGEHTKPFLWVVLGSMLILLAGCGYTASLGPLYYAIAVGGTAVSLCLMIRKVDLKSSSSCWLAFRYGFWLTGGFLTAGLFCEYIQA